MGTRERVNFEAKINIEVSTSQWTCNRSNWKKKDTNYITTAYYIMFIVAINKNNINMQ